MTSSPTSPGPLDGRPAPDASDLPAPAAGPSGRAAPVASARAVAATAAAGIEVSMLADAAGARRAAVLLAEVWSVGTGALPISGDLIRALVHTGNYAAGAWAGGELVGASVGFLALDEGRLSLHSHITGVAAAVRGTTVGYALKLHQRAWALDHGIREITWTFDPLIRINARFNLVRLGAIAASYHVDFYGEMQDGVNIGDRSDRCGVRWDLEAPRVVAASEGLRPDINGLDFPGRASTVVLAVDANGGPEVAGEIDVGSHPGPLLCQVPADIVGMRTTDPTRARAWRYGLRDAMGPALAVGFAAVTITADGWYVLTRSRDEERDG